jgi:predicted outer membrane repeat protein
MLAAAQHTEHTILLFVSRELTQLFRLLLITEVSCVAKLSVIHTNMFCFSGAVLSRPCSGSNSCTLSLDSNSFSDNSAQGNGGAVFSTSGQLLQLQDNSFHNNNATYGPDISTSPAFLGLSPTDFFEDSGYTDTTAAMVQQLPPQKAKQLGVDTMLLLTSNKEFSLTVRLLDYFGNPVGTSSAGWPRQLADASLTLLDYASPAANSKSNISSSTSGRRASRATGALSCSNEAGSRSSGNTEDPDSSLCAFVGYSNTQPPTSLIPGSTAGTSGTAAGSQPNPAAAVCAVGCLGGATTVKFASSVANFSNIGLSAPPSSLLRLQITPRGLDSLPPLTVLVKVQPCGIGEVTNFKGSCDACPVPLINLIVGPAGPQTCSSCPAGASCLSGFPIPQPGFWHSSPRSTQMLPCTFKAACTPAEPGKLVRWQRALKYEQELPGAVDGRVQRYMKVRKYESGAAAVADAAALL